MSEETWKPVVGFEKQYEVSNLGQIRSLGTNRIKSQYPGVGGYMYVTLITDNCPHTKQVHVLVLEAFKGLRSEGQETRHLDSNKLNNNENNLVWGTKLENASDRGLKLTDEQVRYIRTCGKRPADLAREFGVSGPYIHRIIRRQDKKYVPDS